jgi:hypothetical protein
MRRWSWIAIVVLGTAGFVRADDPATPAAAEAATEKAAPEKGAAAEAAADKPAEADKPEAEADAKPADDKPAAKPATPKADPALEAAKDDPDVAARMETLYPLDGEEWREYPLGVLEMEMQEAIEDLSAKKAKPPALVTQPRIISRLDVMIEELEKKMGNGTGSNNAGNKPAERSALRKGKSKDGEMRAVRKEGDKWAELPAKEREKILQSQGEGFPAGYEDVLADYFRKLAKTEKPAPVPAANGDQPAPAVPETPANK